MQTTVPVPVLSTAASGLEDFVALPELPSVSPEALAVDLQAVQAATDRPLRASSYTIYVDLKDEPEEMLLVHAYTGAYDKVSRRVATWLRSIDTAPMAKPLYGDWTPEPKAPDGAVHPPSDEAVQRLKKRGHVTTLTPQEEEAFFTRLATKMHVGTVSRPPSYVLMPTYQCNLRCAYCFQDYMRTDPAHRGLLRVMGRPMVDRIFAGMARIEAVHGVRGPAVTRSLTLFGGEPLLAESRDVIAYIVDKANEGGARASIGAITNGTDLGAYIDLLGPDKIGALQITLDGPPAEHDKRRVYADGSGSFARIAANLTMALSVGARVSVRMNVDRQNIGLLPELADEFVRQGWAGRPGFSSYVAPIHAANKSTDARTTYNSWQLNEAMSALKEQYPSVRAIGLPDDGMLERAASVFGQQSDPAPWMKSGFCGAHSTMYVIDAFGDMYACWERTGDKSLRIGAIEEGGRVLVRKRLLESWRGRTVTSNPVCRRCRYATYCGGGCAILAEGRTGNIHTNFCDGFAARFRASVATAYADHVSGVSRATSSDRVCDL
jgi:uncharacterized protein